MIDAPNFENDINITGARYFSDAPGNIATPGPIILAGSGPWLLANNQSIAANGIHTYLLRVSVQINLEGGGGDDIYYSCGSLINNFPQAGEGLFNESRLDINSNGSIDQRDTACADLPYIVHEKTALSVVQTGFNTFRANYQIRVRNLGGASGNYNLSDSPFFDDDVNINGASYVSNAAGNPGNVLFGTGPWTLAINQFIGGGSTHVYTLTVNLTLDLRIGSSGDNVYRPCQRQFPVRGEGLFNEARLEVDGFAAISTACIDPPYIVHEKTLQSTTDLGGGNYRVVYRIDVKNLGGVAGQYDLNDAPAFDDDLTITSANFFSNAPGHPANPGGLLLLGTGPWNLANNQSIAASATHTYILTVNVTVDLVNAGSPGDEVYRKCGYTNPEVPRAGEGLFNESLLDVNDDGFPDQRDTACADIEDKTASLGDKVFIDKNYNGIQDPNETKLSNVIVYLYDCSNGQLVKKDTTDINGCYFFEQLVGNKDYYVVFDKNSLPPDFVFTKQNIGVNDNLDSDVDASGVGACTHLDLSERDSTYDAGVIELGSIGSFVWHDRNGDGLQSFGEEGIPDVMVRLYIKSTNTLIKSTKTDVNGLYLFVDLYPNDYYVRFDIPSGYTPTIANAGLDTKDSDLDNSNGTGTTATINLESGEDDRIWDLGLIYCASVSGYVFFDTNLNGVFDSQENGINGLQVYLVNAMTGITVQKTLTKTKPGTGSSDGYYSFDCVAPGMYYIQFERAGHLAATDPYRGSNPDKDSEVTHENGLNTTRKITIQSGVNIINVNGGYQIKSTLGDLVWLDGNSNGLQDFGEEPIKGVKVTAYRPDGTMVSESVTAENGHYMLDGIAQGDYFVKFEPTASYGFTTSHSGPDEIDNDADGTNGYGTTRTYRVLSGVERPNIDAGLIYQVLPLEWLSFDARYLDKHVDLNWITGVELNNDHFEIERKYESEAAFKKIGALPASVETNAASHAYNHLDYDLTKSGTYYYRLKQVDKNGHSSYSRVVSIKVDDLNNDVQVHIYPNPTDKLLNVEFELTQDSEIEVRVFDESGKNVQSIPFDGFKKAGTYKEVLQTDLLSIGQYNLQVRTNKGIINTKFTVLR